MMTYLQRQMMAREIIEAMQEKYEAEGEEGDFADGYRHLAEDASDDELEYEYNKWVKQ